MGQGVRGVFHRTWHRVKITLVTIRVPGNRNYDSVTERWRTTYLKFRPTISHDVVIVDSDPHTAGEPGKHAAITNDFRLYKGGGWDCGAWQFAGREIETDFLICCNTSTHFWKHGWMERIVEEFERHGDGLYGPLASMAYFPHIRTPCMAFPPRVINAYPFAVTSRDDTYGFECLSGRNNFTLWCRDNGFAPRMVTFDGCYTMKDWRTPKGVFWKDDQSNLLVLDRHADRWSEVGNRETLNREANG